MKVHSINDNGTSFASKIKYNLTLEKGLRLAKESAKSHSLKDLNSTKNFITNINKILESPKSDVIEIKAKNIPNRTEAYQCYEEIKTLADKIPSKGESSELDLMQGRLESVLELYNLLKLEYQDLLKMHLENIQNKISKS